MPQLSRFECPSISLALSRLLKRTQGVLWSAFILAVGVHLLGSLFGVSVQTEKIAKPLTTKFVKRTPRLTKPLEMKRHPQPKRRVMRRKMVSLKAKAERQHARVVVQTSQVVQSLAKPRVHITSSIVLAESSLEPAAMAEKIQGAKEADQKMDMSLEMLSIESLDTGQFHAMVIQNPHDKREIKGFFRLAGVYSHGMDRERKVRDFGVPNGAIRVLPNIVTAVNRYTDIKARLGRAYCLDSRELLKIPWALITSILVFTLPAAEADNLGKYLISGGFLFGDDDSITRGHDGDVGLRNMFQDALATVDRLYKRDWEYEQLPHSHAIYHCYFDFDGPPAGNDVIRGWWTVGGGHMNIHEPYELEGIHIDERMVGLMSNKDYTEHWLGTASDMQDNARQMQFTINTIIFALTQEGSITHQLMEGLRNW